MRDTTTLTRTPAPPGVDLRPPADDATLAVSRVAAVTFAFWIMKILATTLGETVGDFISMTLNLGYRVGFGVTVALLAAILFAKVRERHYHPLLFWTAIVATTTAGTEISDLMDRSLGLGYLWGSVLLTTGLCGTLWLWYRRHGTLAVRPIIRRCIPADRAGPDRSRMIPSRERGDSASPATGRRP